MFILVIISLSLLSEVQVYTASAIISPISPLDMKIILNIDR